MTSRPMVDARIETYLNRLESALGGLSREYKNDILREIRAHIMDSAEHSADQAGAVDRVLRLLGTPKELAVRYNAECQLERASRSFSPWVLLSSCRQWARLGIKGTVAFLVALIGYSLALGFTGAVFVKPFLPSRLGMWVGPEGLNLGVPSHPEQMHEVLGNYFVPVIAAVAFLTAIATTHLLRWMMRKRAPGLVVPAPDFVPAAESDNPQAIKVRS